MKVEWPEFASVLATLLEAEKDEEENYKETFRVFSKDDEGCIPAQEMKFILSQICSMEVGQPIMILIHSLRNITFLVNGESKKNLTKLIFNKRFGHNFLKDLIFLDQTFF